MSLFCPINGNILTPREFDRSCREIGSVCHSIKIY